MGVFAVLLCGVGALASRSWIARGESSGGASRSALGPLVGAWLFVACYGTLALLLAPRWVMIVLTAAIAAAGVVGARLLGVRLLLAVGIGVAVFWAGASSAL